MSRCARLCARWDRLPPRRKAFLRWAGPLVGLAVVVALVWVWHQWRGVASPAEARWLLTRVGVVAALAGVVLAFGARRWRLQGLGLLALLFGVAGLCARVIGRRGPQPVREWERDLYQSLLDVGSIVVFVALVLWVVAKWAGWGRGTEPAEDIAAPTVHEGYDRRSGKDRRAGWGRLR